MVNKPQPRVEADERALLYRQELTTLRAILRDQMEREYDEKSAEIQRNIDTIAYTYAQMGESMAKVAKRLGTTNWKTAADAVARARARLGVSDKVEKTQADAFKVETAGMAGARTIYKVITDKGWTGGAHTATLYVEPATQGRDGLVFPEGAFFLDNPADSPLHSELRDHWDTSPIAAHIKELEADND